VRRILTATAALLAVGLVLTGCSLPARFLAGLHPTARYYEQTVDWEDCDNGMECAYVSAPLDWDDIRAGDTELALVKHPATGTKRGSLLVDPGGPGGSGGDLVYYGVEDVATADILKHFDIIGVDPRGVGQSSPVTCYSDEKLDDFLYGITPGKVGSEEWLAAKTDSAEKFASACEKQSGALLGHIDAVSVARDLDLERSLVGDAKLNYLGYSYGTYLGTLYAGLFPKRVGRMVLDGATNPWYFPDDDEESDDDEGSFIDASQEEGFEHELTQFLAACIADQTAAVGDASCAFQGTPASALTEVSSLLDTVDAKPIAAPDGRMLGSSTLAGAIIADLYDTTQWPDLNDLFARVRQGDASTAFAASDAYNSRADDGTYYDNSTVANLAIGCLENGADDDPDSMREVAEELEKAAPILGKYDAYGDILCGQWPYGPVDFPDVVHAPGAAPILIVGTVGDPATPYADAQSLAKQLDSGVLLTFNGDGHTAYNKGNSCIDGAVDRYLLTGKAPKSGTSCS